MPEKTYRHDKLIAAIILPFIPEWFTPNMMTVFRLLATPFVIWAIYVGRYDIGIPAFLLVAFSDALDGTMARVRNKVTSWGKVWDPVADKVLIGSAAALLIIQHFPLELIVPVFALEAGFLVVGYYRKLQGHIVSANRWGKLKMLSQVSGVTLYLLYLATGTLTLAWLSYVAIVIATAFAIVAIFTYSL